MKKIAFSSEIYQVKAAELKRLKSAENSLPVPAPHTAEIVVLLEMGGDTLLNGAEKIAAAADNAFVPVVFPSVYTTTLACLLQNRITRGERNEANAYLWTNKKWQISREEAHKRYTELYNSIKEKGYDAKSPMLVMLNRKFGVKDQLLQGHHRIGICRSLEVKEVTVSFWAVPRSFSFMKLFVGRAKK